MYFDTYHIKDLEIIFVCPRITMIKYDKSWTPVVISISFSKIGDRQPHRISDEQDHYWFLGAVSIRKTVLPGMAIPMLKIRRPNGRLIFNMEIAIRR